MPAKKKIRSTPRGKHSVTSKKKATVTPTAKFEALLRKTGGKQRYELKLYVTGTSARSGQAIANIRSLCEEYLVGRYDLEVIDIYQQPGVAATEQIIAAPTLIKKFPAPTRRIVGDLSNRDKILVGLNIVAVTSKTTWVQL
jgi:circadian clock protein KaiB